MQQPRPSGTPSITPAMMNNANTPSSANTGGAPQVRGWNEARCALRPSPLPYLILPPPLPSPVPLNQILSLLLSLIRSAHCPSLSLSPLNQVRDLQHRVNVLESQLQASAGHRQQRSP